MDRLERMNQYLNYISENGLYRNPFGSAWYLVDPSRVLRNQPSDYALPSPNEEEPGIDLNLQEDQDIEKFAHDRSNRIKQTILLAVILLSTFILFVFVLATIRSLANLPALFLLPGGFGALNS